MYLYSYKLYGCTKLIIYDILIWSSTIPSMSVYFECIYRVFQKFHVSFRQDKFHFVMDRVEYVVHDILADRNYPVQSTFDLIKDWNIHNSGSSLHSFVGLVIFYHRYASYLEISVKPLRALVKKYFHAEIPTLA